MSENLAEQITFESEPVEHSQELIYEITIDGVPVRIVPGTLILQVAQEGLITFEADLASCEDQTNGTVIAGMLSEITGLKSVGEEID